MLPRYTDGSLRKYTEWGSYPIFYLDGEDSVLCPGCADSSGDDEDPRLRPQAADINWEDPHLYCDECYCRIESAYAEEDPDVYL